MLEQKFFKNKKPSEKVYAGGPSHQDQVFALAKGTYWTVLNLDYLKLCALDTGLGDRGNAFKHALQTYGPTSENLPDLRSNTAKAKNIVFHGHVLNSSGTTYVLEWEVLDPAKRIMALTNFAVHENFSFKQKPFTKEQSLEIMKEDKNIKIMKNMAEVAKFSSEKIERTELNYRLQK